MKKVDKQNLKPSSFVKFNNGTRFKSRLPLGQFSGNYALKIIKPIRTKLIS